MIRETGLEWYSFLVFVQRDETGSVFTAHPFSHPTMMCENSPAYQEKTCAQKT
jgi:hypothetical protein